MNDINHFGMIEGFLGLFFSDLIKYCPTFSSKTEFLITYGGIFLGLPVH